jgi:hypothetical protein
MGVRAGAARQQARDRLAFELQIGQDQDADALQSLMVFGLGVDLPRTTGDVHMTRAKSSASHARKTEARGPHDAFYL